MGIWKRGLEGLLVTTAIGLAPASNGCINVHHPAVKHFIETYPQHVTCYGTATQPHFLITDDIVTHAPFDPEYVLLDPRDDPKNNMMRWKRFQEFCRLRQRIKDDKEESAIERMSLMISYITQAEDVKKDVKWYTRCEHTLTESELHRFVVGICEELTGKPFPDISFLVDPNKGTATYSFALQAIFTQGQKKTTTAYQLFTLFHEIGHVYAQHAEQAFIEKGSIPTTTRIIEEAASMAFTHAALQFAFHKTDASIPRAAIADAFNEHITYVVQHLYERAHEVYGDHHTTGARIFSAALRHFNEHPYKTANALLSYDPRQPFPPFDTELNEVLRRVRENKANEPFRDHVLDTYKSTK